MKNFYPSILNSNEVYTSATRFETIIVENIIDDPFVTLILPLFRAPVTQLAVAIGRTNDSQYVKVLAGKDYVRDTRYVSLRDYCKGFTNDIDPVKAAAARALVEVFKEVGWGLQNEGYAVESSLLESLIIKLEKAPLSGFATTIGATSRVTDVKTAQADFEDTFQNKVDGKTQELYPKIRNCRIAISRYLGAMLNYIDIMAEVKGGNFSTAATKIDEVIVEFETIARARQTKNTKEV